MIRGQYGHDDLPNDVQFEPLLIHTDSFMAIERTLHVTFLIYTTEQLKGLVQGAV